MRPNDWSEVQAIITAQWPRAAASWNPEEWATWERVCGHRPASACIAAVRRMAETMKGYPKPAHLGDILRGDEAVKGGESKPGPTLEEHTREQMRPFLQAQQHELEAMTDEDVRLCLASHDWQMATFVYGPYARSTVHFWAVWRGLMDGTPAGGWTEATEAAYRAEHPGLTVPNDKPSLARVFEDFLLGVNSHA
jgi:hypothetical protein